MFKRNYNRNKKKFTYIRNGIKYLSIIIVCGILTMFINCKDPVSAEPTNLSINITSNPEGGKSIESVNVMFEGKIIGSENIVDVTIEWWWESLNGGLTKLMESETVSFNSNNTAVKSSVYEAGPGFILLNYYYAILKWTDHDGQHSLESGKAFCISKHESLLAQKNYPIYNEKH